MDAFLMPRLVEILIKNLASYHKVYCHIVTRTSRYITSHIAMSYHALFFFVSCCSAPMCPSEIPLINGPFPIPYSYITASSELRAELASYKARFHYTTAWCPANYETNNQSPTMYIQVSENFSLTCMQLSFLSI